MSLFMFMTMPFGRRGILAGSDPEPREREACSNGCSHDVSRIGEGSGPARSRPNGYERLCESYSAGADLAQWKARLGA
jgi:hypothetical protein